MVQCRLLQYTVLFVPKFKLSQWELRTPQTKGSNMKTGYKIIADILGPYNFPQYVIPTELVISCSIEFFILKWGVGYFPYTEM